MTWVKLDDRFFDNMKIAALSDAAKVAYMEGLTYCARELTDGFIPLKKAKGIAGKPRVVQELTPRLWEPCKDGFRVHDYLDYNPSKSDTLSRKQELSQRRSEAGSKGAAKRWQTEWQNDSKTDGPVTPIPVGDLNDPLPNPQTQNPPPRPPLPNRVVAVAFEQCFGRLLAPTELELVKALEDEHPSERIEYALREAAALNKRSVRYVQRTCERMANDGDNTERPKQLQTAGRSTGRRQNSGDDIAAAWEDYERRQRES